METQLGRDWSKGRVGARDWSQFQDNYLPSLEKQASVHGPQPHDGVAGLEVAQLTAAVAEKNAQAFQQFRGWGLQEEKWEKFN